MEGREDDWVPTEYQTLYWTLWILKSILSFLFTDEEREAERINVSLVRRAAVAISTGLSLPVASSSLVSSFCQWCWPSKLRLGPPWWGAKTRKVMLTIRMIYALLCDTLRDLGEKIKKGLDAPERHWLEHHKSKTIRIITHTLNCAPKLLWHKRAKVYTHTWPSIKYKHLLSENVILFTWAPGSEEICAAIRK